MVLSTLHVSRKEVRGNLLDFLTDLLHTVIIHDTAEYRLEALPVEIGKQMTSDAIVETCREADMEALCRSNMEASEECIQISKELYLGTVLKSKCPLNTNWTASRPDCLSLKKIFVYTSSPNGSSYGVESDKDYKGLDTWRWALEGKDHYSGQNGDIVYTVCVTKNILSNHEIEDYLNKKSCI